MLKVFLGGEGSNDIGTRWHVPMGDSPGVAETLLRRVRPSGWRVAGAMQWRSIRKYRAGAANERAEQFGYELAIVGGMPRPKLEGWILCLLGVTRTDGMTKARVDLELARTDVQLKSNADYVAVAERCVLPTGAGSLPEWLALANVTFRRLIDGVTSE